MPLCVLGLLLAHRHLHVGRPAATERLDVVGAALVTCGLLALLYPLAAGREQRWPPQLFGLAGAGLALLAVFVWHQRGRLRSGESPLLRIDLFADRGFAVGSVLTLLFFGIFAAFLFIVSVTAQSGLGRCGPGSWCCRSRSAARAAHSPRRFWWGGWAVAR